MAQLHLHIGTIGREYPDGSIITRESVYAFKNKVEKENGVCGEFGTPDYRSKHIQQILERLTSVDPARVSHRIVGIDITPDDRIFATINPEGPFAVDMLAAHGEGIAQFGYRGLVRRDLDTGSEVFQLITWDFVSNK